MTRIMVTIAGSLAYSDYPLHALDHLLCHFADDLSELEYRHVLSERFPFARTYANEHGQITVRITEEGA